MWILWPNFSVCHRDFLDYFPFSLLFSKSMAFHNFVLLSLCLELIRLLRAGTDIETNIAKGTTNQRVECFDQRNYVWVIAQVRRNSASKHWQNMSLIILSKVQLQNPHLTFSLKVLTKQKKHKKKDNVTFSHFDCFFCYFHHLLIIQSATKATKATKACQGAGRLNTNKAAAATSRLFSSALWNFKFVPVPGNCGNRTKCYFVLETSKMHYKIWQHAKF